MTKKVLAIVLAVLMTASVISAAVFAADDGLSDGWYPVSFEKGAGSSFFGYGEKDTGDEAPYSADDTVRVSIILNGVPTIEKYCSDDIAQNKAAVNYRSKLMTNQDKVADKISNLVLGGEELDVVWNLTLAANIISANVEYGMIERIKKVAGVKDVVIESCHEVENDEKTGEAAEPDMCLSGSMTDTYSVWANGYTGAGSTVGIVDTGLDINHISFDAGAFEYALSTLSETVDIYTKAGIAAVFDQLNIKKKNSALTVDDVYFNAKVPFAYNYVDKDTDITHVNDTQGEHGSHVAGISAANRYVPDGNGGYTAALTKVLTQGQAPDAQIFVMKVFGKNGGAYDSDYYAAIEDSIILGLDATNLSLGSSSPGFTLNSEFKGIIESMASSNTVVTISAGNAFSWSNTTYSGLNYAEDKSLVTCGDPGVSVNSLCVASVDNPGVISPVIVFSGKEMSYSETTSFGAVPMQTLSGDVEFIAIDGYGNEADLDALSGVLSGKIFICSRGENSFYIKANNAVEHGAAATIIYNNTAGSINMNLTGYAHTAPVIAISQDDGNFIKENAQKVTDGEGKVLYYTGTLTIPSGLKITSYDPEYYTMSLFSSWGVPGSLLIKPEITAPGGNIYSVYGENKNDAGIMEAVGNDKYELMSGTSMASPQIAGISALVAEYIRKNDLETKTGLTKRQLTNALLMGTSKPILEESSDNYYSILKQGAGLVNTEAALKTHTFITMHEDATSAYADGKVKAELGEISRNTKSFSFTFNVNNFGAQASEYLLDADFFTQDYLEGPDFSADGQIKTDKDGNEKSRLYMALTTTDLKADVVWTVNGQTATTDGALEYDFNNDGVFSYSDVLTVLEYVVGNISTFYKTENADMDRDGDIDTYDAYLVQDILKQAKITVAAGQSAEVNVAVTLLDIDDYDIDGAYVEGYVFVSEADDGNGVVSSIPVLGYYGSWTDFSMFDRSSYIEYMHGTNDTAPYVAYDLKESAYKTNYFSVDYKDAGSYIYYGNPYFTDSVYMPGRNAVSPENTLDGVKYTLIRNAVNTEVIVTDATGQQLLKKTFGNDVSAFYYVAGSKWHSTSSYHDIGFDPSSLNENDVFTVTLRAAPEYYAMDGAIDWGSLSDGASFSQQFTVDGTAPEIRSVEFHYNDAEQAYDAVRIVVKDNQYTSCVALGDEKEQPICFVASDEDPNAAPGAVREVVFDLTETYDDLSELPDHLIVLACDYARNESEYYINLNNEEIAAGRKVRVDKENIELAVGSVGQVTASVLPWGNFCSVTWSSADETVARVDENGVITGTGAGNTVITVAADDDPNAYATVNVSVSSINNTYSAILWDDNAAKWFISFDLDDIRNYSTDHSEPIPYPIYSLCYGVDGTLYGATFNNNDYSSDIYVINENTYEAALVGSADYGLTDIAASPAFSALANQYVMAGTFVTYILWYDTGSITMAGALDLSNYTGGNSLVAVAFESSDINSVTGTYVDKYYVVDESGELYYTEIEVFSDGDDIDTRILSVSDLGNIGDEVDVICYQSLYLDTNGYLVWSRTNTEEDYGYIYLYDVSDFDNIKKYDFGSFELDIWPAGGIHEKDKYAAFDYRSLITVSSTGNSRDFSGSDAALSAVRTEPAAISSGISVYSAVPENGTASRGALKGVTRGIDTGTVSFDITADELMKNGLYTISFDPDVYGLKNIGSDADYFTYNLTGGVLNIAFVEPDGFETDDVVATVELNRLSNGAGTVTIVTRESNAAHPDTADRLFTIPDEIEFSAISVSLNPGAMTDINFKVNKSLLEGADSVSVKFNFNGRNTAGADISSASDAVAVYKFSGIEPHRIADPVTATLTATYGETVRTASISYSIKQYCMAQLGASPETNALNTLLVDMLRYGAAVQVFKNYKTNELADAGLTAAQQAPGTDVNADLNLTQISDTITAMTSGEKKVRWTASALKLEGDVAIVLRFAKIDGKTFTNDLIVKYTTGDGNTLYEAVMLNDNSCQIDMPVNMMKTVIHAVIYDGDEAVSNTVNYSVESYAAAKQNVTEDSLGELVKAMMRFGNAAAAYQPAP